MPKGGRSSVFSLKNFKIFIEKRRDKKRKNEKTRVNTF